MPIQRIDIARALAAALATPSLFSQAIATQVQYVPAVSLESLAGMTTPLVTVAPLGVEKRKLYSRGSVRKDFVLTAGVQQKLASGTDPKSPANCPQVDALMQLVDQIADYVEPPGGSKGQLSVTSGSTTELVAWTETEVASYDVQHMIQDGVFTSFVVITYAYL